MSNDVHQLSEFIVSMPHRLSMLFHHLEIASLNEMDNCFQDVKNIYEPHISIYFLN